ncbi:MAG: mannose-1-phosphate guanylyltransferase [Saprospiraceae bacterium]|nr:mannose-1-phosphate guanylyltransferase [Bacteroidia bacterium]NNE16695.1 mannose-1-phosphate guanylyltransferase [Saprospiraceae bacterium]NNL93716.1 mannose-1-phosphate guanylyltransferase [Saprospiraceae bacterium]
MDNTENYYIAIMAGGVGSRFWPASREHLPKQFLDILGVGKSLIRLTYERFTNIVSPDRILVVTNKIYKDLVAEHIPEIPESNIITEPSRNNTGPCVAYTALRLKAMNENASFVIAPSDHVILKEEAFLNKIKQALDFASENEAILTLGIQPTRPDTGYGYIESTKNEIDSGIEKVKSFKEKPNLETAQQYLEDGSYYWNAGIFVWSVKTILNSFETNAKDIYDILNQDFSKYNTSQEQEYIDEVYPQTPSISVDYAILENAQNVYTLPADIGWSDLGTWNALHAFKDKDEHGSVVIGDNTMLIDSKNCIVRSDAKKLVVIKGLADYIVIDEEDVLLVYPKKEEQKIKALRKSIENPNYL